MKIIKKLICFTFTLLTVFAFLSNNAYASETLETMTPIHSYNFDTDTGTTVLDTVTGSAINGTITKASRIVGFNGTGNAMHFDGNSYITFSDKVIPVGKKTISFKIRKEKVTGNREYFFGTIYDSAQNQTGAVGTITASGQLGIGFSQAGKSFALYSKNVICDNNWHNVMVTWDGTTNTNTAKLYIDDMTTPDATTTSNFTGTTPASYNLYIGSLAQAINIKFIGDLDEFQVYNGMYLNTPNGVNATLDLNNNQVDIGWEAVHGAEKYNIYRSETSGTGYVLIGSSTTLSYTDTNLDSSKTYYYVVTAANSDYESVYSKEVAATLTDTSDGPWITGDRAILVITTTLGIDKEYDLSADEINDFLNWYDTKSEGSGKAYFAITKYSNVKPFISRKEYINYSSIENFEVKDYYKE